MKKGQLGYIAAIGGVAALLAYLFKGGTTMSLDALKGSKELVFNTISALEGFYQKSYWDFSQWSVGYGSGRDWDKNVPVTKDTVVNKDQAKRWLLAEAAQNAKVINQYVKVPLNPRQFAALVSFVYNVGEGAFIGSTLLKLINKGASRKEIEAEFKKWRMAGGKVNTGLVNRRQKEINLFFS